MKSTQFAFAAIALLVVTLFASGAARADTFTYSYSSQGQLDLGGFGPCAPCRVMLSITVANALAPSTTYTWDANGTTSANPLDPILDMSFDNFGGLNGDVDPSFIEVVTDASGNIFDWGFTTTSPSVLLSSGSCTGTESSMGMVSSIVATSIAETISLSNCTDMSQNSSDSIIFLTDPLFPLSPWTVKTNVTTMMNAPEPSTLMLLGIGVILAGMKMWERNLSSSRSVWGGEESEAQPGD